MTKQEVTHKVRTVKAEDLVMSSTYSFQCPECKKGILVVHYDTHALRYALATGNCSFCNTKVNITNVDDFLKTKMAADIADIEKKKKEGHDKTS